MKSIFLAFAILLSACLLAPSFGQNEEKARLFNKFLNEYKIGDLINAENTLQTFLKLKDSLSKEQLIAIYNNLGVVSLALGDFDKALGYNFSAENLIDKNEENSSALADIFTNRGNIYNIKKSFDVAIVYLEKCIRIYLNLGYSNKSIINSLSYSYINISIALNETKQYQLALKYLEKNLQLTLKYNLSDISLTNLNIAKTYVKLGDRKKAKDFYIKCISSFKKEYGEGHYRIAEVYFDYGLFLRSEGKTSEAIDAHRKALNICLKNYGEKHTLVSLSYKHIADDYMSQNNPDSALYFYQRSLIAVVKNYNNQDIFSNPSIDSSLFDIRLLDNLKSKAAALEAYSARQTETGFKLRCLNASLGTIELALQMIDRIRNDYMSEESRIYLAENEKETYLFATHLAFSVFSATHDKAKGSEMYSIAQKAKAAILRNEISGNELLYSTGIPDTLREKQNSLAGEIAAYNNLLLEENRKTHPDSNKITLWKDALFDMNREKEKVTGSIEKIYPQFHDLIRKTEPMSLEMIQHNLQSDETIIDYLLSNQYTGGRRKLYIFLISKQSLDFRETSLDSSFVKKAEIIRKTSNPSSITGSYKENFISSTEALSYMYQNLFKPVEDLVKGTRIIVIPDEEIGWLPFDSFLKNSPGPDQTDYEGLSFLINDYTFSYGYSSSLIFNKSSKVLRGTKVYAFSPDYGNSSSLSSLRGTGIEIQSIYNGFGGENFSGGKATKQNFKKVLQGQDILHLAMHSMSDSINSKYSYLMFDTHNLDQEEGKLFNYEISLTRIKSPMVVLSACNSGSGTLYFGEGLMSLARGFTLAGASSVIKTAWDINDESSAAIMTHFYSFLSKGKEKNVAMRLAKLEYLKNSSPEAKNPYYWAAYEVLGDNSPIAGNRNGFVIVAIFVIIASGAFFVYFRRRKIFSERSL